MNNTLTRKKIPLTYFVIPFAIQLFIILIIPSKSFYTYKTGQNIVIQTRPIDPYDLLRGYSQTLSYEISNLRTLQQLPGGSNLDKRDTFYLTLEAPESLQKTPPLPWNPMEINKNKPSNLATNQIALKGIVNNLRSINYGLETYYMPENQRQKINQEIRDIRVGNNTRQAFFVEIKVDKFGNSIPYSLWLGENNYRF